MGRNAIVQVDLRISCARTDVLGMWSIDTMGGETDQTGVAGTFLASMVPSSQ